MSPSYSLFLIQIILVLSRSRRCVCVVSPHSRPSQFGTIAHEVFERALLRRRFDAPALSACLGDIVNERLEDAFACGCTEAEVVAAVDPLLPAMVRWAQDFMPPVVVVAAAATAGTAGAAAGAGGAATGVASAATKSVASASSSSSALHSSASAHHQDISILGGAPLDWDSATMPRGNGGGTVRAAVTEVRTDCRKVAIRTPIKAGVSANIYCARYL